MIGYSEKLDSMVDENTTNINFIEYVKYLDERRESLPNASSIFELSKNIKLTDILDFSYKILDILNDEFEIKKIYGMNNKPGYYSLFQLHNPNIRHPYYELKSLIYGVKDTNLSNTLKYLWRAEYKGSYHDDMIKAKWNFLQYVKSPKNSILNDGYKEIPYGIDSAINHHTVIIDSLIDEIIHYLKIIDKNMIEWCDDNRHCYEDYYLIASLNNGYELLQGASKNLKLMFKDQIEHPYWIEKNSAHFYKFNYYNTLRFNAMTESKSVNMKIFSMILKDLLSVNKLTNKTVIEIKQLM